MPIRRSSLSRVILGRFGAPFFGGNMNKLIAPDKFFEVQLKQLLSDIKKDEELESWLAAVPPGHDQRLANYGIKARRPAKTAV